MKASIADLKYKTKDILKALEMNESITVLEEHENLRKPRHDIAHGFQ